MNGTQANKTRAGTSSPAGTGVPASAELRLQLREAVRDHVATCGLVPPLSMEEVRHHAGLLAAELGAGPYLDFLTVLIGSEAWRGTIAALPYDRRVLLLPRCLRSPAHCRAEQDAFGLLCEQCGHCKLGLIQAEAERLGYVVLIAEGTTVVTQLLEQGQVDAVLGVSCLDALEKSFPHLAADAIPGMAIPLVRDGCVDTDVDLDWVLEMIRERTGSPENIRIHPDTVRGEVDRWFAPESLQAVFDVDSNRSRQLAAEWLGAAGKRWRPFLLVCVHRALADESGPSVPSAVRDFALAVECFHKASLIHDDIEDGDEERYGKQTMHCRVGVPLALNTGDLLIGEGYRLIAAADVEPRLRATALRIAAESHRNLCLGQGEELFHVRDGEIPDPERVLEIFRLKTAPAFEVALRLGALTAGADEETHDVLEAYSRALGTAYQIRDDLRDFADNEADGRTDSAAFRVSILASLAWKLAGKELREEIAVLVARRDADDSAEARLRHIVLETGAGERATLLLDHYRNEALRALYPLRSSPLKSLLRRVVGRILGREPLKHSQREN